MRVEGRVPRLALLVVLAGRAVALELSTGFRFDSPMGLQAALSSQAMDRTT